MRQVQQVAASLLESEHLFRAAMHVLVAEREGRVFIIWPLNPESKLNWETKNSAKIGTSNITEIYGYARNRDAIKTYGYKSGKHLQEDLCAAGFSRGIKFDGGHSFSLLPNKPTLPGHTPIPGFVSDYATNHLLGIKLKR